MSLFDAVRFVMENSSQFGDRRTAAEDFAHLLALPELQPDFKHCGFGESPSEIRFGLLCDLFDLSVSAGIRPADLPSFETETLEAIAGSGITEAQLQAAENRANGVAADILLRSGLGFDAAQDLRNIIRIMRFMPFIMAEGGRVSRAQVMATLNLILLRDGEPPVFLPDRVPFALRTAHESPAGRRISALIVDDDIEEALRTFRALVGWPNVSVRVLVAPDFVREDVDALRVRLAKEIVSSGSPLGPDIVIMDQGMAVPGDELIREVEKQRTARMPVLVGNTGGSPDRLAAAGAIGNLEKGRCLMPMREAIQVIG